MDEENPLSQSENEYGIQDSLRPLQMPPQIDPVTNTIQANIEIVRQNLYKPIITPEIENLITSYIDAYHSTLDYCLREANPDEGKVKELELLSGPINEIYNPNNAKMFDGNTYPAVEFILSKINEYASGLEKGFTRTLKTANSGHALTNDNQDLNTLGYLSILFIFIMVIVFGIGLGYLLFILKK